MENSNIRHAIATVAEVTKALEAQGIEVEEGINLTTESPKEKPPFPHVIFMAAVLKDALDALDFTIIGLIITIPISLALTITLWIWVLGKASGGWWKKKLMKKLWIKFATTTMIENAPFGKVFPASSVFVLMAHKDETKVVRILNTQLERLRRLV